MGLALQLSNLHHHLAALVWRFMSQPHPAYIPGLFTGSEYRVETRAWHDILRENASSCKLMRLEFCKTRGEKLHEFLILYFSHPTHTVARAVVVVDRAVKDRSQSSVLVSPCAPYQKAVEALDRVHVLGQGDKLDAYLSKTYEQYDKLCILTYTLPDSEPTPQPPSAIHLSTLLLVVTNHQPNYNLYEYNCYWYANTIFEACKSLFPGYQEDCNKHGDRGRCRLNVPMCAMHSLPDICREYHVEWKKVVQRWRVNQGTITQQELERTLEEERRAHEVVQQVGILCDGLQLVSYMLCPHDRNGNKG
ncbi:hypothetical protein OG21DRAFT_134867 [Imleria badia]|nr:hypothetical protein OG21DRAFT_134867 [Imleria badia]